MFRPLLKKALACAFLAFALPALALNSARTTSLNMAVAQAAVTMEPQSFGSVVFQLSGTWTATVTFEATIDGTNWIAVPAINVNSGASSTTATANGMYMVSSLGTAKIRARVSAYTSGTLTAIAQATEGVGKIASSSGGGGGGDASAANQTSGAQLAQIVDSTGSKVGVTGHNLQVNCANCSGSGVSATDSAAFVNNSSTFAPSGGFFQATPTANALATGRQGMWQMTANRAGFVNMRNAAGTEVGTSGAPLRTDPTGSTAQPVSGTVTANAGSGTFAVSAATLPLPTGAATAAKQPALGTAGSSSADVLSVQGIASGTALPISGTVTANAGSGTFAVSAASLPLPTGAATAAKQPALGTAGTSSTDVISVQGIASGTAMPVSATSLPLPTLASTSTKQSDGSQKTQIVDGSGNVIASTSNNLNVQCANCSGSGVSAADEATFTPGTSLFASGGGLYQVTQTANPLTTGQQGAFQTTRFRALHVTLRDSTGAVLGNSTTPIQVSIANTGANGTAVKVDNSAVTQPVSGTVTANAGTGTFATNVSQINGVTPLMGNGVTGTGSPRVTIASDNTAFTVNAAQSGTWTIQPGNTANTTAWKVDNSAVNQPVVGAAAHGASISGAPVRTGARARTSDISTVTNDQVVDQIATPDGKAVFMPYALRPSKWHYTPPAAGLTSTTPVKVKSGASGLRVCTTSLQVMSEHQTISTEVIVYASPGAGAAADTLWRGWAQAIGGGAALAMPVDVCTPNTGDSLKVVESTATGTAGVLVNLQGYTTAE